MSDFTRVLQVAIYNHLNGDTSIAAPIYDHVPDDAAFPHVSFGPVSASDAGANSFQAQIIDVQIDIWSRHRGTYEAKTLMAQISARLHEASLTIAGGLVALIRHSYSTVTDDPDGLTRHGVMRFTAFCSDV